MRSQLRQRILRYGFALTNNYRQDRGDFLRRHSHEETEPSAGSTMSARVARWIFRSEI